ncbi:hypothetical protein [Roseimicrobium gellanilyticum]|nr:hypothetical protein [Roseimicrobium gellanilyticum]
MTVLAILGIAMGLTLLCYSAVVVNAYAVRKYCHSPFSPPYLIASGISATLLVIAWFVGGQDFDIWAAARRDLNVMVLLILVFLGLCWTFYCIGMRTSIPIAAYITLLQFAASLVLVVAIGILLLATLSRRQKRVVRVEYE